MIKFFYWGNKYQILLRLFSEWSRWADKVSLNTAAIKNPDLVEDAVKIFGSSNIVVAIEAIKQTDGKYLAYIDNGREHTGIEVVEWAKKVEQLGAGEILVTSVDRDGTGSGFDIELNKSITDNVNIPIIAHGGASTVDHIESAFKEADVDAIPPKEASAPGSMGKNNPLSFNSSLSCLRVT